MTTPATSIGVRESRSARSPNSSVIETESNSDEPTTSCRYGIAWGTTEGAAPSRRSSGPDAPSMMPVSTTDVPQATVRDAASASRARAGLLAPMALAISAAQAKPTANSTDCERWKNCVA